MMSSMSPRRRFTSAMIFPANTGTSSGFAMPLLMISAKPEMEVSGVLSSWETLAENSRRCCSCVTSVVTFLMV